jgi:hypothetical protein
MSQPPDTADKSKAPEKPSLSFWKAIGLIIIFTVGIVTLFGAIIFLFIAGAERIGVPSFVHIAILVVISGVFAWLLKRLSDTVSEMSHLWFPEETDEGD